MLSRINSTGRLTLIVFASIAITALGIDAFDTATGTRSTLLGQLATSGETEGCPTGMVPAPNVPSVACVDVYEASVGEDCPAASITRSADTVRNLEATACQPASVAEREPWIYVQRAQAAALCARAGKRLPSAAEWYQLALGGPVDTACVTVGSEPAVTGSRPECVTPLGTYDTVGNVWEWVTDDVRDGQYDGRPLPSSGYVAGVDAGGVVTKTAEKPVAAYNQDYAWSAASGTQAIVRGGFYGSRSDAGTYTLHAAMDSNMTTSGIGFRCVR